MRIGLGFFIRWFRDGKEFISIHAADIIPIDLNCLLLNLEEIIAEAYQFSGDSKSAEKFLSLAMKRKKAIDSYCWNEDEKFLF